MQNYLLKITKSETKENETVEHQNVALGEKKDVKIFLQEKSCMQSLMPWYY